MKRMSPAAITRIFLLIPAALLTVAAAAPGTMRIRSAKIAKHNYVSLADVIRFYGMAYSHREREVICRSRYSTLRFTVDNRIADINGVDVLLCLPIRDLKGEAMLGEVDFRRTLEPIMRRAVLPRKPVRTVLLDPGHGGKDEGAARGKLKEKEITLDVANQVAALLRARGYTVHLTRSTDSYLTLEQRVAAAARLKADVLVSIHANAATATTAKGIETFACTPQGVASTNGGEIKSKATAGNLHDLANTRLAFELQRHLLHRTKSDDRGVRRANFLVLRDAPCAAALVEMGFVSNPSEAAKLATPAFRRLLAVGIADGLIAYDQALSSN